MVLEERRMHAALTPWEHIELARHPERPRMLDYTGRLFEDFVELHGDRSLGDDPAMVCGVARFEGRTVFVAGQQKGVGTEEKVRRNFGMSSPEGYRKALRVFRLAEKFGAPIITFVDTPAAHPGVEAENHGQGPAIASNLMEMAGLRVPVLAVVLGEGGSGGALGIAVADRVVMFELAVYMICPPERCAEILWRDESKKTQAAAALKITAADLLALGAVDRILPEPGGGAHRNPGGAAEALRVEIQDFLRECGENRFSPETRRARFDRMGVWMEEADGGKG